MKVSAASHTHNSNPNPSSSGLFRKLFLVSLVGLLAWAYQATRAPPPKICGTPDGPPITAPRIKLSDGRHLAYKEHGVPKHKAQYRFIYIHGFDSCRNNVVLANFLSPETVEDLGIYIVAIDRPGYGESDPNPNWTIKSIALDVEEFADKLELGDKFYVAGFSMGGQAIWSCFKYIPHRLAGATLIAPAINYWWESLPGEVCWEVYKKMLESDKWALRVGHYTPWLIYWWNTQKLFPVFSPIIRHPEILSHQDKQLLQALDDVTYVRQQGEYESIHKDIVLTFGKWEFDPTKLKNPFPNNEGSVHIWQGNKDRVVPATLQRYIAEKLPWIHYHEVKGGGHLFPYAKGMSDTIIKTQLSLN